MRRQRSFRHRHTMAALLSSLLLLLFVVLDASSSRGDQQQHKGRILPAFANDFSEVAIAALIERSFESDFELHLVVFFVGHKTLRYMPQMPFLMLANTSDAIANWKRIAHAWYNNSNSNAFSSASSSSPSLSPKSMDCYIGSSSSSKGVWMPSQTSADPGLNRNIEVLRCKLNEDAVRAMVAGRKSNGVLDVRLVENQKQADSTLNELFHFQVPLRYRRVGFGFALKHSRFKTWGSSNSSSKGGDTRKAATQSPPVLHLCNSIIRPLEPTRPDVGLAMLLENVEHNIEIGFTHQFLGIYFDAKRSPHFERFRLALQPYIRQGLVSLSSLSLRGFDDVSGFLGTVILDDFARYIHQQQCFYYSKGVADYVALLHASEFLVPLLPHHGTSLPQLLLSLPPLSVKGQDNKCFYTISSYGVLDPEAKTKDRASLQSRGPEEHSWTKDFFSKGSRQIGPLPAWAVLIVPTRHVWIVGWHVVGACGDVRALYGLDREGATSKGRDINKAVTLSNDAVAVPTSAAEVLFYRGHFDPWQLARPSHTRNNHTLLGFAQRAVDRLTARGFAIQDNLVTFPSSSSSSSSSLLEPLPVGRIGLMASGIGWLECRDKCKHFGEVLFFP